MTGWELYDTAEDWWIGIAWGEGGTDIVSLSLPIPIVGIEPYFA